MVDDSPISSCLAGPVVALLASFFPLLLASVTAFAEVPSAELRYEKKRVAVLGHQIAYI